MDKTFFKFKRVVGDKELVAGVKLDYIVNFIFDNEVLYLFLNEQIEAVRVVDVPVNVGKSKSNPAGWDMKQQARTVKESYTLEVTEKEDIDRFLEYMASASI